VPVTVTFLIVFALVMAAAMGAMKVVESRRKKQVNELLDAVERPVPAAEGLLRDPLARPPLGANLRERVENRIRQSGLEWTPEHLAGMMALFGAAGAAAGAAIPVEFPAPWRMAALGAVLALFPALKLQRARSKRLAAFEEQFPEALDFLARSMRAGHAFVISLEMLAEEMQDPLGKEIRTLFNEQNLGAPLEVALRKLTDRVPLLDVRFFASAVLLQKQTGGNLNEILARLSYVIRERFRLKGQVRAAAAHGRMTATILSALPAVTFAALMVVAPGYIRGMMADQDGKYLLAGCVAAQILGNLVIRRIIDIKV
jgi:tight adherence protein B